jgi:2-polyprenyl-6-methoxyphenol hydroxylase-like FAD-dependent oxidoreductase
MNRHTISLAGLWSICGPLLHRVSHLENKNIKTTQLLVPVSWITPISNVLFITFLSLHQLQRKMKAPTIAIIGGGPCGLTLARLLAYKGVNYVVYKRYESENSNRTGGSLDLHPETRQHALREGGLFGEFKRYTRYDNTLFALADKLRKRLLQIGQGRDALEIDRSELRQILLDAIPKDKVKWGHTLTNATVDENNRPILQFVNGVVLSGFKLLVGADGAWSKVRPMV